MKIKSARRPLSPPMIINPRSFLTNINPISADIHTEIGYCKWVPARQFFLGDCFASLRVMWPDAALAHNVNTCNAMQETQSQLSEAGIPSDVTSEILRFKLTSPAERKGQAESSRCSIVTYCSAYQYLTDSTTTWSSHVIFLLSTFPQRLLLPCCVDVHVWRHLELSRWSIQLN